jgi:hypothetical protein
MLVLVNQKTTIGQIQNIQDRLDYVLDEFRQMDFLMSQDEMDLWHNLQQRLQYAQDEIWDDAGQEQKQSTKLQQLIDQVRATKEQSNVD